MRLTIVIFVALFASPALAYDLRGLSQQDMLLLGEALDAMPHGKVAGLYNRIQQQISAQESAGANAERAKIEEEVRAKMKTERPLTPAQPFTPLPVVPPSSMDSKKEGVPHA